MIPGFILLLFEDVSGGELILVLLAVFLLFGPNKIPEMSKKLAKGIARIRKATDDIKEEVNKTVGPIKKEMQGHIDTLEKEIKDVSSKENNNAKSKENQLNMKG
jgi:TatA/E family protein of Tat protein translocase